jgi:hypothetical protein
MRIGQGSCLITTSTSPFLDTPLCSTQSETSSLNFSRSCSTEVRSQFFFSFCWVFSNSPFFLSVCLLLLLIHLSSCSQNIPSYTLFSLVVHFLFFVYFFTLLFLLTVFFLFSAISLLIHQIQKENGIKQEGVLTKFLASDGMECTSLQRLL